MNFWRVGRLLLGLGIVSSCQDGNYVEITAASEPQSQYVGSQSCKECHSQAFEDWQQSDHFKAMQKADENTVLGDFSGATYTADGVSTRFFKKGNDFFIYTEGNDGNYREYKVLYTFGYRPLQQYLVEGEGGRLQVMRQSWDTEKKVWFHQYEHQKIPHSDWLHWTGNAQTWNLMCAYCHSTNLQKNYHPQTDTYSTNYSELTVGCESCHGAGKAHTEFFKNSQHSKNNGNYPQLLTEINTQKTELNACMPCHSRRGELGSPYIKSKESLDNFLPEIPAKPLYFADGQVLDENYKYASFLQSKMYRKGVRCSDCHNPHTTRLKQPGYQVCLQCHNPATYDTPRHTFHEKGATASSCISCHMPKRTYMGNDIRHDHIFRIPRPDLSEKYATPNACNSCHSDKSAQWATQALKKWLGRSPQPDFSEDLILGSFPNPNREKALWRLLNDSVPEIIQATAIYYLGEESHSQQAEEIILKNISHRDAQVRYQAVRALYNFPLQDILPAVKTRLTDPVRAVRVAAADVILTQLGISDAKMIPEFEKARIELENFLLHQSDFAQGSAALGDYYVKMENTSQALHFYENALKKDPQLNYVRINLASLYSWSHQEQKALEILKEALLKEPNNEDITYRLGLLCYQMKLFDKAENYLQKTVDLKSLNPRVYYNYSLLLNERGKREKAVKILQKGLKISPDDADLKTVRNFLETSLKR